MFMPELYVTAFKNLPMHQRLLLLRSDYKKNEAPNMFFFCIL